jgi:hypothetical protein
MPESLPATVAELDALHESAKADIRVIQARHAAGEDLTREDTDRLKGLLEDSKTIKAARDEAATTEAEHAKELSGLLAEAEGAIAAGDEVTDEGEVEASDDSDADAQEGGEAPDAEAETEPALAAAGAKSTTGGKRPVNVTGLNTDTPTDLIPDNQPGWRMHPNSPGYRADMGKVGFHDIAMALETMRPGSRASFRPNRPNKVMDGQEYARQVVSTLDREVEVVADAHALVAAITKATEYVNGKRVTTEALVAAGGWCAPSEQLYDFCDVPNATDLVSLPEITINRGGIRWPIEPDLSGIFEDFEWFFTEPELEAVDGGGNPTAIKQCVEIPCANEFNEIRLNAVGWCVESGILQEQGWPELVTWFMQQLTQEHLRALSRRTILNVVSGSGSALVIPPTSVMGSVASVLNSLALMATNIRLKRGLGRTYTIEGIAPSWFFEVLRADLAFREGTDIFAVSDAQILGWLTARNIALQFVGDWQTRATGLPGNLATLTWPGTVDIVLYPAGTWFRSMSNVIELGVMYPKEQLQVNRFTRMFTEDAIAVGKRCYESILTRIPLDTNGAIGARETITISPGTKTNTVTITGIPTGGNVDWNFSGGGEGGTGGPVSALAVPYNDTAAQVKTALVAMDDSYSAADFTVTGGPGPGTPWVVTYPAELGTLSTVSHLTGGTSPAVAVS